MYTPLLYTRMKSRRAFRVVFVMIADLFLFSTFISVYVLDSVTTFKLVDVHGNVRTAPDFVVC